MKILYVLEHYHPYIGGAENLFLALTQAMAAKGHDVHVVTTKHDPDLKSFERFAKVNIHRVSCFNRFLFTFFSLPKVLQLARQTDFIHTTTYNAALPAWLAGKLRQRKVLITFHEVWGDLWWRLPFANGLQKTAFYYYEQMILRLSFFKYIAVSEYTKECLIHANIPAEKIVRIYNGLVASDFKNFTSNPPEKFTYTFFGRLGISKGLDLLLEAASGFYTLHPDTHFKLILPKKPKALFDEIMDRIAKLKLDQHVQLLHHLTREELFTEVANSSCVVIPSHSEGFCFVAAESVALGVPIVSSEKGALREVVSGKYLPISTLTVEGIRDALLKAKEGRWEEKPSRTFSFEASVKAYLSMYASL